MLFTNRMADFNRYLYFSFTTAKGSLTVIQHYSILNDKEWLHIIFSWMVYSLGWDLSVYLSVSLSMLPSCSKCLSKEDNEVPFPHIANTVKVRAWKRRRNVWETGVLQRGIHGNSLPRQETCSTCLPCCKVQLCTQHRWPAVAQETWNTWNMCLCRLNSGCFRYWGMATS